MSEFEHKIDVKIGSERSFGLVFAGVFLLIALFPLLGDGGLRWWSLVIALLFLLVTLLAPRLLTVPNRLWFRFGMLLGAIVAPVVMFLVYLVAVVPVGLVMRLAGKDLLRLKLDPEADSYWIKREDDMQPMKNQF